MEKFDLEKIRNYKIKEVAVKLGIKVKGNSALCFMHDDHSPSLAFSVSRNSWKCYVCDKGGDVISLVEEYRGCSFVEACKWLEEAFGGGQLIEDDEIHHNFDRKPEPQADMEMLEYIFKTSRLSDPARKFLFEERKYSAEIVSKLRIRAILSDKGLAQKLIEKFGEERAVSSGLVYKWDDRYVSFYHSPCLLFPYFDMTGKLMNLQARYLGQDEYKPRFQFPVGCKTPIFNLPLLRYMKPGQTLYVSEGVTDCLALLSDRKLAIAIPSATLLKRDELELLAKYRLKMYPDQDEPGERLFQKIKNGVEPLGGTIEKLTLPTGIKDYSDYFRQKRS